MPKSLAWIFQEFSSRGISTRDSYFLHFLAKRLITSKKSLEKRTDTLGLTLPTDQQHHVQRPAWLAGLLCAQYFLGGGAASWLPSNLLAAPPPKYNSIHPLYPASCAGYMSRGRYPTLIPLSQCSPWKLAVHWQVRLSPFGEHVAPFLQGLLNLQASVKFKNYYILSHVNVVKMGEIMSKHDIRCKHW